MTPEVAPFHMADCPEVPSAVRELNRAIAEHLRIAHKTGDYADYARFITRLIWLRFASRGYRLKAWIRSRLQRLVR